MECTGGEALRVHHDDYDHPWEFAIPEARFSTLDVGVTREGRYQTEIDHIIVNKRFCLTDIAVVPKFYTESGHRLLWGRFSFTRKEEKPAQFRERTPTTIINWDLFATLADFWEYSAMDNIDEEYDRLVEHLHECKGKAESFKTTKRRPCLETFELIRQRGAARPPGNQELTLELVKLFREAIKGEKSRSAG